MLQPEPSLESFQ